MGHIFLLFGMLVIFYWILDIVYFMLLNVWIFVFLVFNEFWALFKQAALLHISLILLKAVCKLY